MLLVGIGAFVVRLSAESHKTPATTVIAAGQFPATVDIKNGYVLITLTNTSDIPKILKTGVLRVYNGNFLDYPNWPKDTLSFWCAGQFWDVGAVQGSRGSTTNPPPQFILPLYLRYRE